MAVEKLKNTILLESEEENEKKMQGMFDHGVTVLFVSHSLQQVERLCNKAILLDHGQLIAKGDIDEVSAIYQSKLND